MRYHQRLFVWLLVYSLLIMVCFVAFQYHREREFKAQTLDARLQGINDEVLAGLSTGHPIGEIDSIIGPDLRLTLIDMDGTVRYDSSTDTLPTTNHMHREEIVKALAYGQGYSLRRHSQTTGETYFYSAKTNGDVVVRTAMPYTMPINQLLGPDLSFLWFIAALTVVMCVAGWIVTRRLGRHVARMSEFARQAESGEKINVNFPFPKDELGDLGRQIIHLYTKLQDSREQQLREKDRATAEELDKVRLKKQLTQNINHELKTPVATIRVCLETIVAHPDMDPEKRQAFLDRSMSAIQRLTNLLEDVSLITRMDEGSQLIEMRDVDLSHIISDICQEYALRAADKGIIIDDQIKGSYFIRGNDSLLYSVFHNLMANAIAYSGATKIEISLVSAGTRGIMLRFADNGCGVPQEHLSHLFERFYRVDKGRSRRNGGTGLGLSIVRNAINIHGGSIAAENLTDGGLCFTILFPTEPAD